MNLLVAKSMQKYAVAVAAVFFAMLLGLGMAHTVHADDTDTTVTATSISPNAASTDGGDTVVITGSNFTAADTVYFNDIAAATHYVDSNTLSVTVPSMYKGVKDITVKDNTNTALATLKAGFTAIAPAATISAVTPPSGEANKTHDITIQGSGFEGGYRRAITYTNATSTDITGTPLSVKINTSSLVNAGKMKSDGSDIRITDTDGSEVNYYIQNGMNTASTTIWIDTPTITPGAHTLYLNYGYPSATAKSRDFTTSYPNAGSVTKTFSSQELYVAYASTNQNTCKTWSSPAGVITSISFNFATEKNYDFFVLYADDVQVYRNSGTISSSLTTSAQTIKACLTTDGSNQSGFGGQVSSVVYGGMGLKSDAAVSDDETPALQVTIDGSAAKLLQITATAVTVTAPAHAAGTVDVAVTNPYSATATAPRSYAYELPPSIQSVSPSSGATAGGDAITLKGDNFSQYSTVSFNGVAAQSVTYVDASTLIVTTPQSYKGAKDVTVQNGSQGGSNELPAGYTFIAPAANLSSASPSTGIVGKENQVTINGSGFEAGYKRAVTYSNPTSTTIPNTVLSLTIDTASLVSRNKMNVDGSDIRFTDEAGSELKYWIQSGMNSTSTVLYVKIPDILVGDHTIYLYYGYPSAAAQSSDFTASVPNTTNLSKTLTNQELYVAYASTNQNTCKTWSVSATGGATSVTINHETETNYDFYVVYADGTQVYRASGNVTKTITLPSPAKQLRACLTTDSSTQRGFGGQITQVTYNGLNIKDDATVSSDAAPGLVATSNGRPIGAYNISNTSFDTVLTSNQTGAADITVTNPFSQTASLQNAYTFVSDTTAFNTVSPQEGSVAGGDTVTVTGDNFDANTKIKLNDTYVQNISVVDSRTLSFTTPSWEHAIPVDVTIESGLGQNITKKDAFTFKEANPTITSVTPAKGPSSGNQNVTVTGTGFSDGYAYMTGISTASDHTCGIYSGKAYCWGLNANGQLGNNTTTNSAQPTPVDASGALSGLSILSISASTAYTCALASNGQVYCWGLNSNAQLGDGTTTSRRVPVLKTGMSTLSVTSLSTAPTYACAIASGQAYCWGNDTSGQLGDGDASNVNKQLSTVDASGALSNVTLKQVTTGSSTACAVSDEGKAYCWGLGTSGQLGNGSRDSSSVPVLIDASNLFDGKRVTNISVGATHACAVASANVYCWGANSNGKTGLGLTSGYATLPSVVRNASSQILASVTDVQVSYNSSCAVAAGSVYCWGYNVDGQLGNGTTTSTSYPTAVTTTGVLSGNTVKGLSLAGNSGTEHACVIVRNEQSACWGDNSQQALGNNSSTDSLVPVRTIEQTVAAPTIAIDGQSIGVTSQNISRIIFNTPAHTSGSVPVVVSRYDNTAATSSYEYAADAVVDSVSPRSGLITGGDTVIISGSNFTSNDVVQFGTTSITPTFINQNTLSFTIPPTRYAKDVSISITDEYGQVFDAGVYSYILPKLAITSVAPSTGPLIGGQTISVTGQNFYDAGEYVKQIDSGANFSCAIYLDDQAYCWGANSYGQLGNGTKTDSATPVAIMKTGALAGKTIKSISAGYYSVCAIASDDQVYCWGMNTYGQLGNGSTTSSSTPVALSGASASRTYRQVSVGFTTSCAITTVGAAYCWGSATSGIEIGANLTTEKYTPTAVYTGDGLNGKTIKDISTGYQNSCVIASDDKAYCWGINTSGQLGNGTTTNAAKPVTVTASGVLSGKSLKDVSTFNGNTCALSTDNKLFCWGINTYGQLGNNTTTSSTVPAAVTMSGVLNGKTFSKVDVGTTYGCTLSDDNIAYCWGRNNVGQLGANSAVAQSNSAVQVDASATTGIAGFNQLSTGVFNACAIGVDDKLYCWGSNTSGALGTDAATTSSAAPIKSAQPSVPPQLYLDGQPVLNSTLVGTNQIQGATPAHAQGAVTASIQNYTNDVATQSNAYTYVAPLTVSALSPAQGLISGGDTITVKGQNFDDQTKVKVGDQYVQNVTLVDSSTLTFTTPTVTVPGNIAVTIEDQFGQQTAVPSGFSYMLPAPTITNLDPAAMTSNGGKTVTIHGAGFIQKTDGGTWYTVAFGDTAATNVQYVDDQTITATAPTHAAGLIDVTIAGQYVTPVTATNSFTYLASKYGFSNTRLRLDTNASGMLTITAYDAANNAVPSPVDTTITLSSNSSTGQFATDLDENISTRWNHTSVVLPAGRSSVDVWYRDSTSGSPVITGLISASAQTFTQAETIDSPYRLSVSGISNPIQAGNPSSVTVRAIDRNGYQVSNYTGTIHFTSTDPTAQLPPDYTFTSSDYGIKTFTNGVAFGSQGTYAVRATSTTDSVITGVQSAVKVTAANQGTISKLSIISPVQRVQAGRYSAAITVQTQDSSGATIPVSTATTVYYYSSSPTAEFSTDTTNWSHDQPFQTSIPAGSTTANIYYRDSAATTATLTARDQAVTDGPDYGLTDASQSITTGLSPPTRLSVSGPTSLKKGAKGTYTVQLQDEAGNAVSAVSDVTLRVDSSDTGGQFFAPATSPTPNQGPFEFTIPSGSSSTTIGFTPSVVADSSNKTSITFVDGRPTTETIRLNSATNQLQVVNDYETALTMTPLTATLKAGNSTQLTVGLQTPDRSEASATQNRRISLSSSSSTAQFSLTASPFTPVTSVSIAEGQKTATFYVRDTATGNQTVSVTSSGLSGATARITTNASDVFRYGVSRDSLSTELEGVSAPVTVTGYDVYGNVAPSIDGSTVYLYNNKTGIQFSGSTTGPWSGSTLTIPAGLTSATFYVKATDFTDTAATITVSDASSLDVPDTGIQNATVTARTTSQKAAVTRFTTETQEITAGETTQKIDVSLEKADGSAAIQDGSTTIGVFVSSGSLKTAPDATTTINSLAIARGQSHATMYYTGTKAGTYAIAATAPAAASSAQQAVTVVPAPAAKLVFKNNEQTIAPDTASGAMTLELQDQYGNATTSDSNRSVTLATACASGSFSLSQSNWVSVTDLTIPAGSSTGTFYYKDTTPGRCTLTAESDDIDAAQQQVTMKSYDIKNIVITSAEQTIVAGQTSQAITVSLQRENGTPAYQDGSTALSLSTNGLGNFTTSSTDATPRLSITIPSRKAEVTLYYTSTRTGAATVSIASASGASASQAMHITAAPVTHITYVTPARSTTMGAPTSAIRVELRDQYENSAPLTDDASMRLSSTCHTSSFSIDQVDWQPIQSLPITKGSTNATFYYKDTNSGTCTISASLNDLDSIAQTVSVASDAYPAMITLMTDQQTHIRGDEQNISVSLLDQYGNVTAAKIRTIIRLTSSEAAKFSASSVSFDPGQSTQIVTYRSDLAGQHTITASDVVASGDEGADMSDAATTVPYVDGEVKGVSISGDTTAKAGTTIPFVIHPVNANGIVISTPEPLAVTVSSNGSGSFNPNDTQAILEIEAGSASASSSYTQTTAGAVTLSATSNKGQASKRLSFVPGDAYEIRFTNTAYTDARALEIGERGEYRIQLYDIYGNVTSVTADTTFYVTIANKTTGKTSRANMRIQSGDSTGSYTLSSQDAGDYTISISDSQTGSGTFATISQAAQVVPGEVAGVAFAKDQIDLERGAISSAITLNLTNASGVPVAATKNTTVHLKISSGSGQFSTTQNGTALSQIDLTFSAGQNSRQFYFRSDNAAMNTGDGSIQRITASTTLNAAEQTDSLDVAMHYGAPVQLKITTPSRTQQANHPSAAITVEQQNQYGKAVPSAQDQPLYLRSSSENARFGSSKTTWGVSSITLKQGESAASVYFQDSRTGSPSITIADTLPFSPDVALANASQTETVTRETTARTVADFLVTNITDPQPKGVASSVVVVARDADGYVVDNYAGTVHFSSSDGGATLPAAYTFTTADKGVKVFENQVAFSSPGEWTVAVADANQVAGSQQDITVLDGNTAAVKALRFTSSTQPELAPAVASQNMTLELRDGQNVTTTAPFGGFPVHLTSSSSTGEFSTSPSGPWQNQLTTTVGYGKSFINFYYRDTSVNDATVTATDWQNGQDSAAISNDTTVIPIRSLYLESSQSVLSKNVFGTYSNSKYLFSSQPNGAIAGKVQTSVQAYRKIDGAAASVQWRTQWLQGVTILSQSSTGPSNSVDIDIDNINTNAGARTFYTVAQGTESSFSDPYSVVSKQLTVPISSWIGNVALQHQSDDVHSPVTATIAFTDGSHDAPAAVSYDVYRQNDSAGTESIMGGGFAANEAGAQVVLDESMLPDSTTPYRFVATAYDAEGNIIAQASELFSFAVHVASNPSQPEPTNTSNTAPSKTTNNTSGTPVDHSSSGTLHVTGTHAEKDNEGRNSTDDLSVSTRKTVSIWSYAALLMVVILVLVQTIREVRRRNVARAVIRSGQTLSATQNLYAQHYAISLVRNAFFWLPIVLSVVLSVVGNILIRHIASGKMPTSTAIVIVVIILVVLVSFFVARSSVVRRQMKSLR